MPPSLFNKMKISTKKQVKEETQIPEVPNTLEAVVEILKQAAERISGQANRREITTEQREKLRKMISNSKDHDEDDFKNLIIKIQEENYSGDLEEYLQAIRTTQRLTDRLSFNDWVRFENICQTSFSALKEAIQIDALQKIMALSIEYSKIKETQQEFIKKLGFPFITEVEE